MAIFTHLINVFVLVGTDRTPAVLNLSKVLFFTVISSLLPSDIVAVKRHHRKEPTAIFLKAG